MLGSQAVGRAFRQALRQEYQASMSARHTAEEEGRSGSKAAQASSLTGISLNEAKQILNVQNLDDTAAILKVQDECKGTLVICNDFTSTQNYEHLHKINIKSTGGSFYLQSKVFRARERIEMELNTPLVTPESSDKKNQT